jgi:hypothetical protein
VFRLPHGRILANQAPRNGITSDSPDSTSFWIGSKNLVSVRLYSTPHLHLIILAILGIAAVMLFEIMHTSSKQSKKHNEHFPDASIAANQI